MKKKLLTLIIATCTLAYTNQAKAQTAGAALNLDGIASYVDLGTDPTLGLQTTNFSIEAWVNPTGGSQGQLILFNGACDIADGGWGLSYNGGDFTGGPTLNPGKLSFYVLSQDGNYYQLDQLSNLPVGKWTHVAVTNDGTTLNMYINGALDNSLSGNFLPINTNSSLKIGTDPDIYCDNTPRYVYNGSIDELRIWTRTLTSNEIRDNFNTSLTLPQTGLAAYYNFNEGIAGANNAGVTSLTDLSGNAFNGTLFNFALTGTTSNWIAPDGAATPAAALNFDGVDDRIDLGYGITTALKNANAVTVEAWVNPSTTSGLGVIAGNYNTNNSDMQFLLRRDNDGYSFWVGDASGFTFSNVTAVTTATTNVWQHVAGVWDGNSLKIYVNGVLASTTANVTGALSTTIVNNVWIGDDNVNEAFTGSIDEVRIWTRAVCQGEIQNNMNGEIAENSNGLLAYYKFNQGFDNSNNTTINILADSSASGFNGIIAFFALTGTTSNFVAPGAVTSGSLVSAFTSTLSAVATQTNVTCNGNADGIANIVASSNDAAITYSWTAGSTAATQTGLAPATYTCTVTNGCGTSTSQTVTITEPAALVASSTSGTIACNGDATTVTVAETGGTSPYSGDGVMSGITANDYTYTVTDNNGCASTTTITVTEPTALVASSSANAIACNGGVTTVTVTETGGVSPYTVSGDATSNVIAGSYSYTVTDANGCTSPATITLNDPAAIDASVTSIGDIITATDAIATYQWVDCNNANAPIVGETNQSYTAISSGSYAVIVTEGSCSATSTCTPITTSGIAQNKTANSLQVYPNPFSNELTITSSAKTNAMLFDMLGNQIKTFALQNTTQTINVGDLAPGMYYLQVDAQKIKIIKQ